VNRVEAAFAFGPTSTKLHQSPQSHSRARSCLLQINTPHPFLHTIPTPPSRLPSHPHTACLRPSCTLAPTPTWSPRPCTARYPTAQTRTAPWSSPTMTPPPPNWTESQSNPFPPPRYRPRPQRGSASRRCTTPPQRRRCPPRPWRPPPRPQHPPCRRPRSGRPRRRPPPPPRTEHPQPPPRPLRPSPASRSARVPWASWAAPASARTARYFGRETKRAAATT
ncbi:hypothetical protein DFJ73DRAFT_941327, partial [Zopfochytrium polystomum]